MKLPKLFRRSKGKAPSGPAAGILSPSHAGNSNSSGGFGSGKKTGKRLSKRQLRKKAKKDRAAFPVASAPLEVDKENKARAPQSGECHATL